MLLDLLPRSVRLALLWESLDSDQVYRDFCDGDEPHRLHGLELRTALGLLSPQALWAVLPGPGDVQGCRVPAALEAGEAVVVQVARDIRVLVPAVQHFGSELEPGTLVRWEEYDGAATLSPSLTPGEVRLALVHALHEATETLTALDVSRERPDLREAFLDLRGPVGPAVEDVLATLPERSAALLVQALRVLRIVELARGDVGAAVTAGQTAARATALAPLERAGRTAVAVATFRRL